MHSIEVVRLFCDFVTKSGQIKKGKTANLQKTSVVRAEWRQEDIEANLPTPKAKAAYKWLVATNSTYRAYVDNQKQQLVAARANPSQHKWHIRTAELLLHSPGIEVAARPVLYPRACFADTDVRERLLVLGHIDANQKPSIKDSFMRKVESRCVSYFMDFKLLCFIHDVHLARHITAAANIAKNKKIAPETTLEDSQTGSAYWEHERDVLQDDQIIERARPP